MAHANDGHGIQRRDFLATAAALPLVAVSAGGAQNTIDKPVQGERDGWVEWLQMTYKVTKTGPKPVEWEDIKPGDRIIQFTYEPFEDAIRHLGLRNINKRLVRINSWTALSYPDTSDQPGVPIEADKDTMVEINLFEDGE